MSLSFGHRFSERPDCLPACLPAFCPVWFYWFRPFSRCLLAPLMTVNSRSFVIKNGTESGHRLDNYIFHIVQIANDCCCGNLITLHLMKRQLMPHDHVPYTHTGTRAFALFKLFCSLFMTFSFSKCFFFFQPIPIYLHFLEYLSTV